MREQGGATLFSPVIERTKLSVKVMMAESSESKRRLSNGGGVYTSYVGAKSMLAGSMMQPTAPAPPTVRLKGGSTSSIFAPGQRPHNNGSELLDLSAEERLKEFRARLEPFLKPKAPAAPSAPLEEKESGMLPQWGLGKRSRRSRFEASKHVAVQGRAHESAVKALLRAEKQPSAEDSVIKLRGHGWAPRPAPVDADSHAIKGAATAAARNGISSRAAANILTGPSSSSGRYGISGGERERTSGLQHKGEPSSGLRQRSDGSAELPINNCNGHAGAFNRAPMATETGAASASHSKPRSDLQTLEWPRILIGLSRKEKEDDFLIFKGTKLPQRPKKRLKAVERTLHYCTPGNSLCDLSRGRYDVREKKSVKKRPRGLKAMESMESDSD